MMRFLRYLFLAVTAFLVIALSVANRHFVSVYGWPDLTAYGVPATPEIHAPLFLVAVLSGAVGFLLGALREYFREGKHRRASADRRRELGKLQRQVDELKRRQNLDEDDEIIALTSR